MKEKTKENQKAITLIALIVTIIILLILAGISIASLTGNGLFEKVKLAKEKQENAQIKENTILADYENKINGIVDSSIRENNKDNVELLATVKETSWTEYKIENINDYKYFVAYIIYPRVCTTVQSMIILPEQLKVSTEESYLQPTYYDGNFYIGKIYYINDTTIKAQIVNADSMKIYGVK